MLRNLSLALVLSATFVACSKTEAPPAAPQATAPAQAAAPATGPRNSGKVLQVQQGGGYTYAEVTAASGQSVWIAGAQINVKAGDTLEWGSYDVMRNFTARSLNRTFDEILFVSQWGPAGGATVTTSPHGTMGGAAPPMSMTMVPPGGAGGGDKGVVKSVVNAGGYSYIEVDRGGATLWVAATEVPMKAGDKIEWQGGSEMRNFTAKSVNRTFDRITFASSVAVVR